MLYLLTPNETYYEKMEDVPLLLDKVKQLFKKTIVIIFKSRFKASEFVILLIASESLISLIKYGKLGARFNDGITSSGSGIISRMHGLVYSTSKY